MASSDIAGVVLGGKLGDEMRWLLRIAVAVIGFSTAPGILATTTQGPQSGSMTVSELAVAENRLDAIERRLDRIEDKIDALKP